MDCEKFDQLVIDALYEELDELNMAALKRHTDGCTRCHAAWSELRATRKLGVLPMVEAPAGLEERILGGVREAHDQLPWPRRIGRAISWAGSYAMRPQLAMAALLLLMLGSSVLFLRAKPDRSGALSRVHVTERGVPERGGEEVATQERLPTADSPSLAKAHGARRDEERGRGAEPFAAAAPPAATAVAGAGAGNDGLSGGAFAQAGGSSPAKTAAGEAKAEALADEVPGERRARAALDFAPSPAPPGAPTPADDTAAASAGAGARAEVEGAPATEAAEAAKKSDGPANDPYAAAMALYTAGRYADAAREFDRVAAAGGRSAASAALYAGKSVEASAGCVSAAPKYESAGNRFSGTSAGAEAMWAAATCYRTSGQVDKARSMYVSLRSVAGYRDRAEAEIAALPQAAQAEAAARARSVRPAAKAAAAPASPPPARPSAPR